jgi:hypothetical protein
MILLYNWLSAIYWTPGPLNSILISTEKAVPSNPENSENIKYNVPISLAFVDKNHRSIHIDITLLLVEVEYDDAYNWSAFSLSLSLTFSEGIYVCIYISYLLSYIFLR